MRRGLPRTRQGTLIRSKDSGKKMLLPEQGHKVAQRVPGASQLLVVAVVAALSNNAVHHLRALPVEEELADEQVPDIIE